MENKLIGKVVSFEIYCPFKSPDWVTGEVVGIVNKFNPGLGVTEDHFMISIGG